MRTIIALKERTGRDDTESILGRTYYIGSNAEDDQPEIGPASLATGTLSILCSKSNCQLHPQVADAESAKPPIKCHFNAPTPRR